jgi:uncharacterized DUF497 family protein
MSGGEFEWDSVKARANLAKHKVSFAAAQSVFGDAFALERHDMANHAREVRYIITGMSNGVLLTIVYTERGDRIRIISARKATRHEQHEYYRNQTSG